MGRGRGSSWDRRRRQWGGDGDEGAWTFGRGSGIRQCFGAEIYGIWRAGKIPDKSGLSLFLPDPFPPFMC